MTDSTAAIVLCLGAATRMRPLSLTCPKALLPFCGRPLLEYTLEQLRGSPVAEVIIVAGCHDDGFERYASVELSGGMKTRIVRCGLDHGSGGVLKHLAESFGLDAERLLVIYGDSLLKMSVASLLAAHHEKAAAGCLVTVVWHTPDDLILPGKANTNYGILWLGDGDRCVRFAEKPSLTQLSSGRASAGVFVLDRCILNHIPGERPLDLSSGVLTALASGSASPVFGFQLTDGYRFDIGTIADYVDKQFAALDGIISVDGVAQGPALLGGAKIGRDSRLYGHNIFGNDVRVGENCEITDCVVLDGSVIEDGVKMTGVVLGRACHVQNNAVLGRGTELGDWSVVSAETTPRVT